MNLVPGADESTKAGNKIPFHPQVNEPYSVQVSIEGLDLHMEMKVWHKSPSYMCLLVKENSHILPLLKTGAAFRMNYYGNDIFFPFQHLETEIRKIRRHQEESLREWCFVEVEILRAWH